jgi:hypothetical protein
MEIWKDVKGYEGLYQVSSEGRVKSLKRIVYRGIPSEYRTVPERILKGRPDGCGYLQVRLYKNGVSEYPKVHRLVANAFIPNDFALPQVNHKNGVKKDNCICNLEWVSTQRNIEHACASHYTFVNPEGEKVVIYNLNKFCKDNSLSSPNMSKVLKGERNHHKGWTRYEK